VIDEDMLLGIKNSNILYKPVPLYPETVRDVAFIAKESLSHREIVDFIFKAKVKNLEKVQLFDVFRDKKVLGPGKKSLAYSLTFRNSERTLRDKEVNKAHEKLRSLLAKEFNIELR
jgi:phenylalanyl-tRNA synthetase beta chain